MEHYYEKYEDGELSRLPMDDKDGRICGHIVIGLPRWMDENPEERKRLGWIKHITFTDEEIKEKYPHKRQTQFLVKSVNPIDDYTVEDVYHVMDKSEEQMLFEEMLDVAMGGTGGITFF